MFLQTFIYKIHLKKCIPLFLLKHIDTKTYHKNLFTQNPRRQLLVNASNIFLTLYFGRKHLYEVYFNVRVILVHFFKALYEE